MCKAVSYDPSTCFWCGCSLNSSNCTKDHLLSKPLRRFVPVGQRNRYVYACSRCNQLRGRITSLYLQLILCRKHLYRRKTLKAWLKARCVVCSQCNPANIRSKLAGLPNTQLCLHEIDTVMTFSVQKFTSGLPAVVFFDFASAYVLHAQVCLSAACVVRSRWPVIAVCAAESVPAAYVACWSRGGVTAGDRASVVAHGCQYDGATAAGMAVADGGDDRPVQFGCRYEAVAGWPGAVDGAAVVPGC